MYRTAYLRLSLYIVQWASLFLTWTGPSAPGRVSFPLGWNMKVLKKHQRWNTSTTEVSSSGVGSCRPNKHRYRVWLNSLLWTLNRMDLIFLGGFKRRNKWNGLKPIWTWQRKNTRWNTVERSISSFSFSGGRVFTETLCGCSVFWPQQFFLYQYNLLSHQPAHIVHKSQTGLMNF